MTFIRKMAITRGEFKTLITLLNPVAPHITEELWQIAGFEGKVYQTAWPEFDEAKTVESSVEIAVQINGKTKGTLSIGKDDAKEDVIAKAKEAIADKLTGNIKRDLCTGTYREYCYEIRNAVAMPLWQLFSA